MHAMFEDCPVPSLDLSNFNTIKVITMSAMFACCRELTTLDINHFDTSNVTNFGTAAPYSDQEGTFERCSKLASLDISNWNTAKASHMVAMFEDCTSLSNLKLNFDMSSVTDAKNVVVMFKNCTITSGSIVFNNVKTSVFTDRATFINKISGSGISDSILTVNFV
jgi:surface protein